MAEALIGAVEAGGTKFVLALARKDGTILRETRIPTRDPRETFAEMADFFRTASASHGPIGAFGVASFGPIDIDPASPTYGTFTATPKPGWQGARFHDALGEFGVPVRIETDVNGAAMGEWLAGAGRGCRTLAYTTVGTGIGTGVVTAGTQLAGFSHYEAGHIPVRRDPARDPFGGCCPFHGDCLEGLAAGPAIVARWGDSLDKLEARETAVELVASYIAQHAATLVLMHMPDRLIYGGGVMHAPGLIAAVRRQAEVLLGGYVANERLDPGLERYIVLPGLGDDAGITGAIALGRQALDASA
ncbi:ROK family protein [Novosphingobium sp. ZN18A2]|uniref:ROK family protein n=1 Tax=Novosphingobium sp. ZN18A2 TaxID=3079861 RepID=UPI0030D2E6F5